MTRWLQVAVVASSSLVFCAWFLLAFTHLGDRYQVGHGQGVWIALANHFNEVGLYPAIDDGVHFGGTRYMPLPFVLHGLLARVTGEYLVSGKLLGLGAMLALLALVFHLLRRIGCQRSTAFGLSATVMAGGAGLLGGTTIGGDVLPVVFQVAAVALVAAPLPRRRPTVAAFLCALGLLCRLNALWAPIAIILWLRSEDRRQMWRFAFAFVTIGVVALLFANMLSGGRMSDNVFGLATAGTQDWTAALKAPYRFLEYLLRDGLGAWALLPFVGIGSIVGSRTGEERLLLLGLIFASSITVVTYTDIGTGPNQLVDVIALTALTTGAVVGGARDQPSLRTIFVPLVAVMIGWIGVTSMVVLMRSDIADAFRLVQGGESAYPAEPLKDLVSTDMTILSEDPGLPVQLGQMPVVFDPFMFLRLGERDPSIADRLVHRIDAREFDRVILREPLHDNETWWRDYHFGTPVADAIMRSYTFETKVRGYYVYVPTP
jgi:hypothetical protein